MNNAIKTLRQISVLQVFLCFCSPWCLFYTFFETFFENGIVLGKPLLYNLIVPSLIFFVIGTIINYYAQEVPTVLFRHAVITIIILFILDQGIKLIVVRHQDIIIPLIDNWLSIRVYHNIGHILNTKGIFFPSWLYILFIPIPFLIFRAGIFYQLNRYFVSISVLLFSAGMLCSYTDKILYGGSYDYIYLQQFAIVDLKDIYILMSILVLCQATIYNQNLKQLKKNFTDLFGLQYFRYEYHNIKRWFSRKQGKEVR